MGNSRGAPFSFENEKLDWIKDEAEFWDFSYPELAMYDLPAAISTVHRETGGRKVIYIGSSLGTTEFYYSMQSPYSQKILQEVLSEAITLAPIFIPKIDEWADINLATYELFQEILFSMDLENALFGPTFTSKVDDFCSDIKFDTIKEVCESITAMGDEHGGLEPVSTKLLNHYIQNFFAYRFQEYSDCWGMLTCHKTDFVNLASIEQIPITHIYGSHDKLSDFEF